MGIISWINAKNMGCELFYGSQPEQVRFMLFWLENMPKNHILEAIPLLICKNSNQLYVIYATNMYIIVITHNL